MGDRYIHRPRGTPRSHKKQQQGLGVGEKGTLILTLAQAPLKVPKQCPQTGSPEGVPGYL